MEKTMETTMTGYIGFIGWRVYVKSVPWLRISGLGFRVSGVHG